MDKLRIMTPMKRIGLLLLLIFSIGFGLYAETLKKEPISQVLVIFGAYGDLSKRELIPALVKLQKKGQLPSDFTIVGVGRRDITETEFLKEASTYIGKEDGAVWESLKGRVHYISGNFDDEKTYSKLAQNLKKFSKNRLFYLATPPSNFSPIIRELHQHKLIKKGDLNSRVLIEKPFGVDEESAQNLQKEISEFLNENQIYRMDHYLGKEVIGQLLNFRFANPMIESLWNNRQIDHVRVTLSESIGVGSRGAFWEQTGMLRDVVQNHIMQVVALIGMEKPETLSPENVQKEKVRLIESIRPFAEEGSTISRGQYGPGDETLPGYRQEKNVPESSSVETFVSAKLWIDNERWQGVPFYLKTGKRLSKKLTEAVIAFKSEGGLPSNELVFRIQPDEEIYMHVNAFEPGLDGELRRQKLSFPLRKIYPSSIPDAYERLVYDALAGDRSRFVGFDELLAAWRLFTPVLKEWAEVPPTDFPNYTAGSDGPLTQE